MGSSRESAAQDTKDGFGLDLCQLTVGVRIRCDGPADAHWSPAARPRVNSERRRCEWWL